MQCQTPSFCQFLWTSSATASSSVINTLNSLSDGEVVLLGVRDTGPYMYSKQSSFSLWLFGLCWRDSLVISHALFWLPHWYQREFTVNHWEVTSLGNIKQWVYLQWRSFISTNYYSKSTTNQAANNSTNWASQSATNNPTNICPNSSPDKPTKSRSIWTTNRATNRNAFMSTTFNWIFQPIGFPTKSSSEGAPSSQPSDQWLPSATFCDHT